MPRIDEIFQSLRAGGAGGGRRALMPFVCGGHAGAGTTAALLPAIESAGASIIEVGIPFSDPIADGPVIAAAMHRAIQPVAEGGSGATPLSVFNEVASVRSRLRAGLVAMVSVSIVHRMGGLGPGNGGFCKHAKDAGFDGLIIPDLPFEESDEAIASARQHALSLALLIAPTTSPERRDRIAKASTGFIYLLARAGITGERADVPDISPTVAAIRRATNTPIACGFGISTPDHVHKITAPPPNGGGADAAIVGSALVRVIDEALAKGTDPVEAARAKVAELAKGLA